MNRDFFIILFALSNLIVASVLIRYSEVGPIASFGYRLLLPCIFLYSFLAITKDEEKLSKKSLYIAALTGFFLALDLAFYSISLIYTSIAEASLLTNLCPFITTFIAIIFLKEKVSLKYYLVLLVAFIGLLLLMSQAGLSSQHLLGNWLAIISAVFYALFIIFSKKLRDSCSTFRMMFIASLSGSVVLFILAFIFNEQIIPTTARGIAILLAIALFGHLLGNILYISRIKHISLAMSSLVLLIGPVFALLYGYVLFRETFSIQQLVGMFIIILSVYLGKKVLEKQVIK
ncbi:DMT family transporter [Francisella philomiragia]|uniref:DMT family transporter n=1 Tax=Francisella philomiragia TaxID=28110 RepID=A0AAW3D944_9GAMM|nr:DMT family transporter [Francisella philomiragia]AJI57720.1 eamA-like transporter family protein [Francisella philomiragia]EET21086.1 drug:metabolite transporter [Francisella philomiragia subsp. philomiragia ATCC 25015]KFJ42125.1 eamA-like transporter family protein [Francisella philomiragia]MBK2025856.1 DMT family transporter [Francisella philomiragia]MBK2092921.1 DMT family transporter [Francisella philomiragia]